MTIEEEVMEALHACNRMLIANNTGMTIDIQYHFIDGDFIFEINKGADDGQDL